MKIITIQQIGFNHPSQANWSWGIFSIGLLDTEREYCFSITAKECFGGNSRPVRKLRENGVQVIELKAVYTNQTPNIKGINKCMDMEGEVLFNEIMEFINK